MDSDKKDDAALDALFSAAKTNAPVASEDFLERLNADAVSVARAAAPAATARPVTPLFDRLKGWFAVSGLSGAAALGVWIGFLMPEVMTTVSPLSEDVIELSAYLPGADLSVLTE